MIATFRDEVKQKMQLGRIVVPEWSEFPGRPDSPFVYQTEESVEPIQVSEARLVWHGSYRARPFVLGYWSIVIRAVLPWTPAPEPEPAYLSAIHDRDRPGVVYALRSVEPWTDPLTEIDPSTILSAEALASWIGSLPTYFDEDPDPLPEEQGRIVTFRILSDIGLLVGLFQP